jgi:hypothetical protein
VRSPIRRSREELKMGRWRAGLETAVPVRALP